MPPLEPRHEHVKADTRRIRIYARQLCNNVMDLCTDPKREPAWAHIGMLLGDAHASLLEALEQGQQRPADAMIYTIRNIAARCREKYPQEPGPQNLERVMEEHPITEVPDGWLSPSNEAAGSKRYQVALAVLRNTQQLNLAPYFFLETSPEKIYRAN